MEMTTTHITFPDHAEHFGPDPDRPGYLACTVDDTVIGDELYPEDLAERLIDAAVAWFTVGSYCPICAHDALFHGALPAQRLGWSGAGNVACGACGTVLTDDDEWALPLDVDEVLADELDRAVRAARVAVA